LTARRTPCTVAHEKEACGMPSKKTGRELRRFFLELLEDKNLEKYHQDRRAYIRRRTAGKKGGYLGPTTQRLLESDDLREIEESIMLITGSNALPLWVVAPPYS
jgi:hypothetical protein